MNNKRNWGKEIKQVGILIIIIGAVMLGLIFYGLSASGGQSSQSALFKLVDKHFIFLIIGGLVAVLAGVIIRSIGRSKELKFYEKNGMNPNFPNQPYYPNQPNPQYNPYQQPHNSPDQQNNNHNNQQ